MIYSTFCIFSSKTCFSLIKESFNSRQCPTRYQKTGGNLQPCENPLSLYRLIIYFFSIIFKKPFFILDNVYSAENENCTNANPHKSNLFSPVRTDINL